MIQYFDPKSKELTKHSQLNNYFTARFIGKHEPNADKENHIVKGYTHTCVLCNGGGGGLD